MHAYRDVGEIPKNLTANPDPAKRILLERLPLLLRGYGKIPGVDAVLVVLDADNRNCVDFLSELTTEAESCAPALKTMFRLAIEEIEAWYLGDRDALREAYRRANTKVLDGYIQDSACRTWELLADALHSDGSAGIEKTGWPLPGQIKHAWAEKIGPLLDPTHNASPSFGKLRDGVRRLVVEADQG